MGETTVYDKVSWHFPEGKSCPSLEAAKAHFKAIMQWLKEHNLLTEEGLDAYEAGIDDDFAITSTMLNDIGNKILREYYSDWLRSIGYKKNIDAKDMKLLDEALKENQSSFR